MSIASKMMSISVIVPTLNARSQITRLLESLYAQSLPPDEIIVVDSGSNDGTPEIASKLGARVMCIPRWQFNHGQTRNFAISRSRGDLVVLTVQDALPCDNTWLEKLCLPLLQDESLVAVSGRQLVPITAAPLARLRARLWEQITGTNFVVKSVESPSHFWSLSPEERLKLALFDNVTSCVRRTAWSAKPFPRISFGEDIAWATEALLRGWRIAWVPEAVVWHYHCRSIMYEFRRAFLAGYTKASVLRWPAMPLSHRDAIEAYKEARNPSLLTGSYCFQNTDEIKSFLYSEILKLNQCRDSLCKLYERAARFSWGMLNVWEELYASTAIPEKVWHDIVKFSIATIMGEALGLYSAHQNSVFWKVLKMFLGRGV